MEEPDEILQGEKCGEKSADAACKATAIPPLIPVIKPAPAPMPDSRKLYATLSLMAGVITFLCGLLLAGLAGTRFSDLYGFCLYCVGLPVIGIGTPLSMAFGIGALRCDSQKSKDDVSGTAYFGMALGILAPVLAVISFLVYWRRD